MENAEERAGVPASVLVCLLLAIVVGLSCPRPVSAQDNYEIQVYPSETMAPGVTMFEFHTNFTADGRREIEDGVRPTEHQVHETLEITHGFNDWFEVGLYTFMSGQAGYGYDWVGEHIRPRFRAPESWHWPVGVSLSQEIGYQRRVYSQDTWTWEIRPIIDRKAGRFYWALNPTLELSLHGPSAGEAPEFAPNVQVAWDLTPKVSAALEYYGGLGPITGFVPRRDQGQQIFPAVNIDFGPSWEFNAGVGVGLTPATDGLIAKVIIGYRVGARPVHP